MSRRRVPAAEPVVTAAVCAAVMIATQVAGKTARDALFLTNFAVANLPLILVSSSLLSIGAVLLTARAVARRGPQRIIPPLAVASGVLLVGEWMLSGVAVKVASILVYLHIAVIGSILISGFWSIVNESFDAHAAKRSIGRIAGGATAGGLLGGLLAERVGASLGLLWVLPIIACLHLVSAALMLRLPSHHEPSLRPAARDDPSAGSGFRVLRRVAYLRHLALVVLFGNAAATVVDFLFKARASQVYPESAELVRFFAIFYTVVSLVTLAVQAGLTRRLLERVGVANTMTVRPAMLAAGGLVAMPFVGLASLGLLRSLEAVIQGSLHRSGYELLFTPVVPADRRRTKTIIDVGADRAGDILGGLVVRGLIFLPAAISSQVLLLLAVAFSGLGFLVTRTLRAGYVRALEASLIDRANALDIRPAEPPATPALMESVAGLDVSMTLAGLTLPELRRDVGAIAPSEVDPLPSGSRPPLDRELAALVELRSGDNRRVRTQLRQLGPLSPVVAAQVVTLLAWDEVTAWAARALAKAAPTLTGQLVDRLLDPDEDFAIRRRIPRILATCATPRARDGLLAALDDKRFEVRFHAAAALASLHEREATLAFDSAAVYAAIQRESSVNAALWHNQRLLDDPPAAEAAFGVATAPRLRSTRSFEHVFTLLSLVLPRAPLQIAFMGLLTHDAILRGTSLEFLESVLPREVWDGLRPLLGGLDVGTKVHRSRAEVLEDLMRSRPSIELSLDALRKHAGEA